MMQMAIFVDLLVGSVTSVLLLFFHFCPEQSLTQRGVEEHENCIHSKPERRRW